MKTTMLTRRAGASRLAAGSSGNRTRTARPTTSTSTSSTSSGKVHLDEAPKVAGRCRASLPERSVAPRLAAERRPLGAKQQQQQRRSRVVPEALSFDPNALASTASSTFKLVLLCGVISRLMKIQMLPKDTPVILSKVAFNVLLPCLLCSKVAVTLIKLGDPSMLGVPLLGIMQIGVGLVAGAFLFKIAELFLVKKVVEKPAMAVAAVGGANGVESPIEVPDFEQQQQEQKTVKTMKSIVKCACAFGNSVTLPLIFFSTLLTGAQYDLAAGYTALYLIAWSPALWSLGYSMFVAGDAAEDEDSGAGAAAEPQGLVKKMAGAVVGFVAGLKQYMNPPMIGVILGVVIGLTPLANIFYPSAETFAEASVVTKMAVAIPKSAMELVEMMAGSLLAIQTMVLAASLLPTDGPKDKPLNWRELLSPQSKLEVAALLIVLIVRFLVVPFAGLGLVSVFQNLNWLPNDPICYLVVLVQAVMPSAQNIVLLMNLQSSTRPLAPTMARILLQLYLLSVVPLALWMGALLPMIGLGGA